MGPKIAIIGGGIGGLTAAVALARKGLAAEVYEQAPVLAEVGAGVGLWPNAMTALEPIGLSGKVAELAVTVTRQGLRRSDGTWLMCFPGGLMAQRWGAGFVLVHRAELQQLLAAELGSSALHLGARCTGFEDGHRAVTARFADGREAQADVLVGADGVHSAVRAQLFGPAPLRYRGYTLVRGITAAGSVPLPADGTETWGRGARFGLGPSSGERIIWYATWNAAAGGTDDGDTAARLRELFGAWHDPIPAIIDATAETALIRNDIYDRRPTRTWSRGRVALIGDAIHPMTPDLAQGACQAIVDATTLATCLAAFPDSRAGLREYQQRRWRNAAITTLMARTMGTMGQWEGRVTCTVRNTLTRAIPLSLQLRQFDLVLGATRQASRQHLGFQLGYPRRRRGLPPPVRRPPRDRHRRAQLHPGLDCVTPGGAFYAFPSWKPLIGHVTQDGERLETDEQFCRYLLHDFGVAVIPGAPFVPPGHFRISYATSQATLQQAIAQLRAACSTLTAKHPMVHDHAA